MIPSYIKAITDFLFIEDEPEPADVIVVCGSARIEPAKRAGELYHAGFSRRILPTGRYGERYADLREEMRRLAENDGLDPEQVFGKLAEEAAAASHPGFPESEWAIQRNLLVLDGVPETAILREDRSVNTFENAIFARRVLTEAGIGPKTMILCCQAFHARRAQMTLQTEFPDVRILLCPAVTRGISRDTWYMTADGYDKVLDELGKCSRYFRGDRMYEALKSGRPASETEE